MFSEVRNQYIETCISREKFDTAIDLLRTGKMVYANWPGIVVDYSVRLKKLYDQLLEMVLSSFGLCQLEIYEQSLHKLYPDQLLGKYAEAMAARITDRRQYREIVHILSRMQKYPEGKAKVKDMVINWQQIYRHRPAMMDEIRKLVL